MTMAAVVLFGCTKKTISTESLEGGDMVLVNLNLTGEVTIDETPLTKAITSDDLIGVQVYEGSNYYAYGLFDDVSQMNIYLHSGKEYKFVCTVVKNGKNTVISYSDGNWIGISLPLGSSSNTSSVCLEKTAYSLPFIKYVKDGKYMTLDSRFYYFSVYSDNQFHYSKDNYFICLQYGWLATGKTTYSKYPQADRFYGEVSGYTAVGNGSLSIPLKRVGFGISLSVSGITDGSVSVTISNSYRTFANNTGITQDTQFGTTTWSFFDLKSAWQYADNYTENFTVGVIWNRGVGVTQNLGTKTVQFKRNAVNRVNVNLGESTKSAGFEINVEEPEIINETYNIGN